MRVSSGSTLLMGMTDIEVSNPVETTEELTSAGTSQIEMTETETMTIPEDPEERNSRSDEVITHQETSSSNSQETPVESLQGGETPQSDSTTTLILADTEQSVRVRIDRDGNMDTTVPLSAGSTISPEVDEEHRDQQQITPRPSEITWRRISPARLMKVVVIDGTLEIYDGSVLDSQESILIDMPANLDLRAGVRKEMKWWFNEPTQKLFLQRKGLGEVAILTPGQIGQETKYLFVVFSRIRWDDDPDVKAYETGLHEVGKQARQIGIRKLATVRAPFIGKPASWKENARWLAGILGRYGISVCLYKEF